MIISRTPFRVSFFGGGTDYPAWFQRHGGSVLAMAINKYCYISVRHLPQFFEHKHRVVYSRVELVQDAAQIQHPVIRCLLQDMKFRSGLEIHHDADLPARSGLGSSSSFTVGLLHALHALRGSMISKARLAQEAIRIEQSELRENVGCQDQTSAAWGGFNRINFHRDGAIEVIPMILPQERLQELESSLVMCFTGITRISSDMAKQVVENLERKEQQLHAMAAMVDQAMVILQDIRQPIDAFGELLHQSWQLKRSLADNVTTPHVDEIYQAAMAAGASGGKLMGAGGGGFMLFVVRPALQKRFREKMRKLIQVQFKTDYSGSKILVYDPEEVIPDEEAL